MLWFKHDTNAHGDAKLKKVRMKYGADGYAIYWYCLECIAGRIDKDNLTFNLEEDAEIIAYELKIAEHRVEDIMNYMISLSLFEEADGMITCLKLSKRLDKSMTNSPKMRQWLELNKPKSVMTCADSVNATADTNSTCAELEENKIEKNRKEENKIITTSNEKPVVDFVNLTITSDELLELVRIRKKNKGGAITQRVANALTKEFNIAIDMGYTMDELLTEWEVRGWKGFKSEWIKPKQVNGVSKQTNATINNLQGGFL